MTRISIQNFLVQAVVVYTKHVARCALGVFFHALLHVEKRMLYCRTSNTLTTNEASRKDPVKCLFHICNVRECFIGLLIQGANIYGDQNRNSLGTTPFRKVNLMTISHQFTPPVAAMILMIRQNIFN